MPTALMTKADLALRVQCHVRTIDNLLARNEAPVVTRIGRLVRFREDDFDAWLDRRRGEPGPPEDTSHPPLPPA
jgi:excisionase family DNA binding protein